MEGLLPETAFSLGQTISISHGIFHKFTTVTFPIYLFILKKVIMNWGRGREGREKRNSSRLHAEHGT